VASAGGGGDWGGGQRRGDAVQWYRGSAVIQRDHFYLYRWILVLNLYLCDNTL